MASKKKRRLKPKFLALFSFACICALGLVWFSQENKLADIRAQQTVLEAELLQLQTEEQRIEYMIEYAQNEEYLLQYAREKLGYVKPDDVKFKID